MAGIFKAYDIRGIYGEDLTDDMAGQIGQAFATFLKPQKVVVGRDMRPHSEPLFQALARGLAMHGMEVIDLGLCSTPMSYYANGKLGADGSIMITASHNPGEYNGFKMCRESAIPLSGETGIGEIEEIVTHQSFDKPASEPGSIRQHDIVADYVAHIQSFANLAGPIKVAIDYANGMGIYEGKALEGLLDIVPLFNELDGTFPNHEANPLKEDTLNDLRERVPTVGADFGIAYDGDADRAGFVDERGEIIPMDLITALIAQTLLKENRGASIYYDLRSSWAVKEVIEETGGKALRSRVGHAFIKQQMRDDNAIFAGELSGHYYFQENYFTESASLAALYIANLVSQTGMKLSELVAPLRRYHASGEINSSVKDADAVLNRLRGHYKDGEILELDGLSMEFNNWWFNVRSSNTEPLIRLNLEAKTKELMESKKTEVLGIIRA